MYGSYFFLLLLPLCFFLSNPAYAHGTTPTIARRSMAHKKRLELNARQLNLGGLINGGVGSLLGGNQDSTTSTTSSSSSSSSPAPTVSSTSPTPTVSSNPASEETPSPSPNPAAQVPAESTSSSNCIAGLIGGPDCTLAILPGPSSTKPSDSVATNSATSPPPNGQSPADPTSSNSCLAGLIGPNCTPAILSPAPSPTSPTGSPATNGATSPSPNGQSPAAPASSNSCLAGLVGPNCTPDILGPGPSPTNPSGSSTTNSPPPNGQSPADPASSNSCLAGLIGPNCTPAILAPGPIPTNPSATNGATFTPPNGQSPADPASSNSCLAGLIGPNCTPAILVPPSTTKPSSVNHGATSPTSNGQSPATPTSSNNCLAGFIGPDCTPAVVAPSPSTTKHSDSPTNNNTISPSAPSPSPPSVSPPAPSSVSSSAPPSVSPSAPPTQTPKTDCSQGIDCVSSSKNSTISFPGPTTNTQIPAVPATKTSQSQFPWLTVTSLVFQTYSSSAPSITLTNPDQAPTPTAITDPGNTAAPSPVPLPSGLPSRILPAEGGVNPTTNNLTGYSMISVLFDSGFSWQFVVETAASPTQIFAWFPRLIETALGISSDQVKTFALQVWIPNAYHSPADIAQLGTLWLGYIPTDLVDTLASQIKAKQSLFYVGNPNPFADLAQHVNPSFAINTVNSPSNSGSSSSGSAESSSSDSKSREDAIIGVVSALGIITLLILAFLAYRAIKRRRELAHMRLSDLANGNTYTGEAPPDRDFDQDSVGGQRRRSFYFAEDSLRVNSDSSSRAPESGNLNRRTLAPSAISAPVMRENSLNF